jgi:hypothetical protein
MSEVQNSSSEEKKSVVEGADQQVAQPKIEIPKDLGTTVQEASKPVGNSVPVEKLVIDVNNGVVGTPQDPNEKLVIDTPKQTLIEELEPISNTEGFVNSWGRETAFQELRSSGSINSGSLERESALEIAGLGSVLKISSVENGVYRESLVFIPGASIIDLYEDHENPTEISGRVLAKK